MLTNLLRVSEVARMLRVSNPTCVSWARAAGIELVRAPVVGYGRTGGANSPWYIPLDAAVMLVDRMLPRRVDRLANARVRALLASRCRTREESTRNLAHTVGGTGSETPTPKPAL
jgi:hypothetical protein